MTQIGMNAQIYAALVGLGGTISTVIWGLQKTSLALGKNPEKPVVLSGELLQNMALVNLVVFPMFQRILQAEASWPLRLTTSLPLIVTWLGALFYAGFLPAQASVNEDAPVYKSFNTLIKCCNIGFLYFVALRPKQLDSITAFSLMGLALLSTVSTFSFNRNEIKSAIRDFFS